MKPPAFDMEIVESSPPEAKGRIKAIEKMLLVFVMKNILAYLNDIYPTGATSQELESFIKKNSKEADPDKEDFMLSNVLTKNFNEYYIAAFKELAEKGFVYAGEEKKFFLTKPIPLQE